MFFYLLEAKEALEAASRIIKAFLGEVNEDDEAFKGCSSLTLEAADIDKSCGCSVISVSNDLTEAVSQVAAIVVEGEVALGILRCCSSLGKNPNLVGKTDNGLEEDAFRGCLGAPNMSSLRALGCNNCGCSANGIGSEVANGSENN